METWNNLLEKYSLLLTVWMLSGEILINEQQVQLRFESFKLSLFAGIKSYCGTRTRGKIHNNLKHLRVDN